MKLLIVKLFTLVVVIAANSETDELLSRKRDDNVGDLKDLLMASMQNTIALTEVVVQQTQKISDMMLSLSAARIDIQGLKLKVGKSEVDEAAMADKISELEDEMKALKGDLNNGATVTVLYGEEENGDPKCAKVCSGTTGRRTTGWTDYTGSTGIFKEVDISGCGFVKIPTITTSIEGSSSHWEITGTSAVYNAKIGSFSTYIAANRPNTRKGFAEARFWNVEWIAVGFTC